MIVIHEAMFTLLYFLSLYYTVALHRFLLLKILILLLADSWAKTVDGQDNFPIKMRRWVALFQDLTCLFGNIWHESQLYFMYLKIT